MAMANFSSIQEQAWARERAWIEAHGQQEYEQRTLLAEAAEELADAWNYLKAYRPSGEQGPTAQSLNTSAALEYINWAWQEIHKAQEIANVPS